MARKQQVAEQLSALMDRHRLTPAALERLTGDSEKTAISQITIRRILKAEARTEPEPQTLRRIAEAVGENYLSAFAEEAARGIVTIDISQRGSRLFLHFVGGTVPQELETDLKKVLVRYEHKLAKPGSAQT